MIHQEQGPLLREREGEPGLPSGFLKAEGGEYGGGERIQGQETVHGRGCLGT